MEQSNAAPGPTFTGGIKGRRGRTISVLQLLPGWLATYHILCGSFLNLRRTNMCTAPGSGVDVATSDCEDNGNRMVGLVKRLEKTGRLDSMLEALAHSSSCSSITCNQMCLMFRRIRRHLVGSPHHCKVRRTYLVLVKRHLTRCKNLECDFCKNIKKQREKQ